MFGKVIYIDKKKLNEYIAMSTGKNVAVIASMQVTNDKEVGVDIPVLSAGMKGSKSYEATIVESFLYDISKFEKTLNNRDDFFDFTTSCDKFDLNTINRGSIIKFDSNIFVPAEFDMTDLIGQFKSMLTEDMISGMSKQESEAFSSFFAIHNPKIPILSEASNYLLSSLIDSESLQITYTELEDYELLEVTFLARIITNSVINKSKPIFDPLKDFMSMNRTVRRQFLGDRPEGIKEIFADFDYKKIEVIAIYQ